MHPSMDLGVLGLGHVGLTTALGLSEAGWSVIGTDSAEEKVEALSSGRAPFFEPGLDSLLARHLDSGRFRPTVNLGEAIRAADVLFVCVGTPQSENGAADLGQVDEITRTIARHLNGYKLVVEKSTSPVRTAERIKQTLHRYRNGGHHDVEVAANPEFLQEGTALHDVLHPDRIVIGVDSDRARGLLERIYRPVLAHLPGPGECGECDRRERATLGRDRLIVTDPNTAEIIKHAANAMLATKISFINMIGDLCEVTGADVQQVAHAIGQDPRIGPHFLQAGIGYGGYCLPKDLRAFIRVGEEHGIDVDMLLAVERVNDRRVERLLQKCRQALWVVRGKSVAILGVAFKPLTDDVREAPGLKIAQRLISEGAKVRLHDPLAIQNARTVLPGVEGRLQYCESAYDALSGAHAAILVTEWGEYRGLDFERARALMEVPVLIDGRNLYDPATLRAAGFEYYGVGR
jgi:UDPglucose 6-dehydrogenase